jgi:hypothetical protein
VASRELPLEKLFWFVGRALREQARASGWAVGQRSFKRGKLTGQHSGTRIHPGGIWRTGVVTIVFWYRSWGRQRTLDNPRAAAWMLMGWCIEHGFIRFV